MLSYFLPSFGEISILLRTFMAMVAGFFLFLAFGRIWISFLKRKQFSQTLWQYVPERHHQTKKETPTLGGILLWIVIFVSTLLTARWDSPHLWLVLLISLLLGIVGFLDDIKKILEKDAHGLRARYKFPFQVMVCGLIMFMLLDYFQFETRLVVPFFRETFVDLGWWYLLFGVLVLVGSSNAVNLTDGLDGLAAGPSVTAFLTFGLFCFFAGSGISGELTVFCGAVVGALLGFLWFDAHPAQVFMGDVGSLPLGGALGFVAIVLKNELLLLVVGGIFVVEALSVIVQVLFFQLTGKRIFKMAPLHHHFELKGWPESKVIVRFWIIAIVLALAGLLLSKLG